MAMTPIKQHRIAIRLVLCKAYTEGSSFPVAELSVMTMQHYEVFSVTSFEQRTFRSEKDIL